MKKRAILSSMLLSIFSFAASAQEKGQQSTAEKQFSIPETKFNQQHVVHLSKDIKLNIELYDVSDYQYLRNLDSLMSLLRADMSNFKDSLNVSASGNIRVDYMFMSKGNIRSMRFKKYESDGDIYSSHNGSLARLKLDKDTVRIIIAKYETKKSWGYTPYTPIQLTFVGKDINEIFKLQNLNPIVDTLERKTTPAKKYSAPHRHKSTVVYTPETNKYLSFPHLQNDLDYGKSGISVNSNDLIQISGNVGLGVLRDRLTPMAEVKIQLSKPWGRGDESVYGISATPYFLFDKRADGNYTTRANWFLNVEMGGIYDREFESFKIRSLTIGAGYLLKTTSNLFNGHTAKAFLNIGFAKGLQLAPEVIFTDNFRQVFPGMTLRIFRQ